VYSFTCSLRAGRICTGIWITTGEKKISVTVKNSSVENLKIKVMDRIENIYEVTQRLCGEIRPYGDTNIDEIRLLNLQDTISVAEKLIEDIIEVSKYSNRGEHSMAVMGKEATDFIKRLYERLI
jgi:hypothetical protein